MNDLPLKQIKSVSQINSEIRQLLDGNFRFVRVQGEISTIRQPYSGHTYFILKDEESQLNSVLFKNQQRWLARELEEGQLVICDGRISVYEPRGSYQLIIDSIDFDGTGQLHVLFERLKQKLKAEGLFSPERKLALPEVVERIVLITSPSGAAVHDFISVCRNRRADVLIQILPVRVQGKEAIEEISHALLHAHSYHPDVIVLCRGGGSLEDLWAFNEELVARAISQSEIPVISGIGHETDFTIADFCADIRCATPTAAAELVTVDPLIFMDKLAFLSSQIRRSMHDILTDLNFRLARSAETLSTFDRAFSHHTFTVENFFSRLLSSARLNVQQKSTLVAELHARLLRHSPSGSINLYHQKLNYLSEKFCDRIIRAINTRQLSLEQSAAVLDTLSPLKTLARGYGIVTKNNTKAEGSSQVVTSIDQVEDGEEVAVKLHKGQMDCNVVRRKP